MGNKYDYYMVIQSKFTGTDWSDESFYTCDSQGYMPKEARKNLKHDLAEYRYAYNSNGGSVRTIMRRELKQEFC